MGFGWYRSLQVAGVNGGWWLLRGFNWTPRGIGDVINAFNQGIYGTFFTGICDYNGAFWTMHYEFLGSIAVYVLAFFVIILSKRLDWRLILLGLLALWIREVVRFPFLASFVLGAILALLYTNTHTFVWKNKFSLYAGFAICVAIGGFTIPENDLPKQCFSFVGGRENVAGRLGLVYLLYSMIALFFLSAALWNPSVRGFLSRPLLRKLGHLSFPIYLIHTPVICSAGAWTYLALHPWGIPAAATSAILVSIGLTLLLAIPLAAFDDSWLLLVRRITPCKTLWRILENNSVSRE
jgi:peptidoglycan/LPS O-acetylase OafA/YrhL